MAPGLWAAGLLLLLSPSELRQPLGGVGGALLFVPEPLLPASPALRAVSLLGIWGTVGMIWLALRPLFAMVQWAWSGYQRSRTLREEARDDHQRLNQACRSSRRPTWI